MIRGISYSGNKRLSTITGREEVFDTPFQTIEGEDISVLPSLNIVINPVEAKIAVALFSVEGGSDNKVCFTVQRSSYCQQQTDCQLYQGT